MIYISADLVVRVTIFALQVVATARWAMAGKLLRSISRDRVWRRPRSFTTEKRTRVHIDLDKSEKELEKYI